MDRREQIVEGATKSFTLFGYKATTMDQIAKLSNVSKGTIYNFFTNKEELFQHIVRSMIEDMKAAADEAIRPEQTFQANAIAILTKILEFRKKHELFVKLTNEAQELGTPVVEQGIADVEKGAIDRIAFKIQAAQQAGTIRPCEPQLTAFLIFRMYLALVAEWKKFGGVELSEETITRTLSDAIFKSLEP